MSRVTRALVLLFCLVLAGCDQSENGDTLHGPNAAPNPTEPPGSRSPQPMHDELHGETLAAVCVGPPGGVGPCVNPPSQGMPWLRLNTSRFSPGNFRIWGRVEAELRPGEKLQVQVG